MPVTRRLLIVTMIALPVLGTILRPALAGESDVYAPNGVAISGYDAVAYFTEGEPVKGDKSYSTEYMGAEWRFASADNLAAFKAEPAKYAPQYGGYCAWAVSQNYTARGNPNNWMIVEGKLYLNYNDEIQKRWEADIPGFIAAADKNWPGVLE